MVVLVALCLAQTGWQWMQTIALMVYPVQLVHRVHPVIQDCLPLGPKVTEEKEDVVDYEDTEVNKDHKEYRFFTCRPTI